MNDTPAALAVLIGLVVRLMIPVILTAAVVIVLSRLDRRWQDEAVTAPVRVAKPECWKTMRCPPAQRKNCPGFRSAGPCWQAFRESNGYLDQKCLNCPVFASAPAPGAA